MNKDALEHKFFEQKHVTMKADSSGFGHNIVHVRPIDKAADVI